MTKLTAVDLTPFYRNAIGIDRVFDRIINQIDHAATNNYPPYNIVETGEHTFELQLAVAGFGQGDIDVSTRDGDVITAKRARGGSASSTSLIEINALVQDLQAKL